MRNKKIIRLIGIEVPNICPELKLGSTAIHANLIDGLPISSGVICSRYIVANNWIVSSKAHTCLVVLMQEGYFRLKTDYLPSKTDCNTITAGSARQEISLLDRVCSAVHCSTIQCNTVHCTILHWCRVH